MLKMSRHRAASALQTIIIINKTKLEKGQWLRFFKLPPLISQFQSNISSIFTASLQWWVSFSLQRSATSGPPVPLLWAQPAMFHLLRREAACSHLLFNCSPEVCEPLWQAHGCLSVQGPANMGTWGSCHSDIVWSCLTHFTHTHRMIVHLILPYSSLYSLHNMNHGQVI